MTSFDPTDEQLAVVETALRGETMKVEAPAGSGKTATLALVAEALAPKRLAYIAFNKRIVQEAQARFPKNVECATIHALAKRAKGGPIWHKLNRARMRTDQVATILGANPQIVDLDDGETYELHAARVASLAMGAVRNFCKVPDAELTGRHVPRVDDLDLPGQWRNNRQVAQLVLPVAQRAWDDLIKPRGKLGGDIMFSIAIKLWQLDRPTIDADGILFDESQDANALMLDIVTRQSHAQIIYIGDRYQAINEWNGAVNAMEKAPAKNTAWLTRSFRFGPEIAAVAQPILDRLGAAMPVIGAGPAGDVATVEQPRCVLYRTNAGVIGETMSQLADGKKVYVAGGVDDFVSFTESAQALQSGRRATHPDLACFKSWYEVQRYVYEDALGGDLRLMVRLIDEFGTDLILADLHRCQNREDLADITLSTAHKAKGLEWESVRLGGDFPAASDDIGLEELRLLYVAVTRAQRRLDITRCPYFAPKKKEDAPADVVAEAEQITKAAVVG